MESKKWFAVALFLGAVGTGHAHSPVYRYFIHSLTLSTSPTNSHKKIYSVLGQGWSSDNNQGVGQCLLGTMDHVGIPVGSLSMDTDYSYNDVMNQLGFKVDGRFSSNGYEIDPLMSFAHTLQDTAYTQTFIYQANVLLKNRHFATPVDRSPLTWIGQQYAEDPVAFRLQCGDKFVLEQKIGGALYVVVKFHFQTQNAKREFNTAFGNKFKSLVSLNMNLNRTAEFVVNNGGISVQAFQVGGDPAKLGKILGAFAGSENAPVLSCDKDTIRSCQSTVGKLLDYVSQTNEGDFSMQFENDDPQSLIGPGIIENILQSYTTVVPVKISPSFLTEDIINARKRLSLKYDQSLKEIQEVDALINSGVPMSSDYYKKLKILRESLNTNVELLRGAGQACYEDNLSRCLIAENVANSKLIPIELSPFLKRIRSVGPGGEAYLFPYAENQFIYLDENSHVLDGEIYTVITFTKKTILFTSSNFTLEGTSDDAGLTYQIRIYNSIISRRDITLTPDFTIEDEW